MEEVRKIEEEETIKLAENQPNVGLN